MKKYRRLHPANPEDVRLAKELENHTMEGFPGEPEESIYAFFLYFLPAENQEERENRSVAKAIATARKKPSQSHRAGDPAHWEEWANEWRWMERAMVWDFMEYDLARIG